MNSAQSVQTGSSSTSTVARSSPHSTQTSPESQTSSSSTVHELTVGSTFAGVGGFDLGLEAAGPFRTVWHSEIDPAASRVMAHRWPDSEALGDIRALTEGFFPPVSVDVITGGPPCQDISEANSAGRLGLAGPRSGLFRHYADLIGLLRPRWVVMEQVTGLLTSGARPGADYALVLATFKELGYAVDLAVVNSLRYVPQTRERIVLVGHRQPGAATRALLPLTRDGAVHPDQGRPPRRRPPVAAHSSPGLYRKSRRPSSELVGETWVPADYSNTLTVSDVNRSRATVLVVDTDDRVRVMTPEEWEGCHGFPAGWTVAAGGDYERWRCLGNAVSPPIMQRVGEGILAVENTPLDNV